MAEFRESQKKYTAAKIAVENAVKEVYAARQQVLLAEKQNALFLKSRLRTQLAPNNALNKKRTGALSKMTSAETKLQAARDALNAAREEFKTLGAASETLANLNDATPILLMPLRVQTRFLTTKHIARNIPEELLVDVNKVGQGPEIRALFPNLKPLADPFASISSPAYLLSNQPSQAVKDLIARMDAVIEGPAFQKRWQKVEDEYELWVRIFPDDLFLQTHEEALTETELAAAKNFWQRMWDAERTFRQNTADPAAALKTKNEQQLEAWKTLRFDCLPHRAAWAARILRPADFPARFSTDMETIPANKFPVPQTKLESWSLPPQTDLLPEQFAVRIVFKNALLPPKEIFGAAIPDWLQLGFDPDEKDEAAFGEKGRVLELPKALRWLTDLTEAEKCGMAVRVPLSRDEYAAGISKLVVVGIKTGADTVESTRLFIRLLENHRYRPDGLAFLRQGTATNNLPDLPTGFTKGGLTAEESFQTEFSAPEIDPRSDGQRLTTALGLEAESFARILNQNKREGEEALLVNRALWPGTLGYYLDNLMRPIATDADIALIKTFFQNFVTGRGLLPSFRVGKQPYGIVPATAWSAWKADASAGNEEQRLIKVLKKLDEQWGRLTDRVKTVKRVFENTDAEAVKREFRELLTYQAHSTRFFRRLVAGEYLLWNINQSADPIGAEKSGIRTAPPLYKTILEGAGGWNEPVEPRPRILGKFIDDENYKLTDLPPVTSLTATGKEKNYLRFLLDASFVELKENFFGEDFSQTVTQRSSRLMFQLARFAYLQGWMEAALNLLRQERPNLSPLARLDFEFEYLFSNNTPSNEHKALLAASGIAGNFETLKNKWAFFEQTLSGGSRVDDHLTEKLKETITPDDPAKGAKEVRAALEVLADFSVEKLECTCSEHIDLCSHRLDAWLQGLVLSRLFSNRQKTGFEKGLYLGAFGYVENLLPGNDPWIQVKEVQPPPAVFPGQVGSGNVVMPVYDFAGLTPEQIETVRRFVFVYLGSDPATSLMEDPDTKQIVQAPTPAAVSGDGFVLTPSLEHAATAGILRAGYEHHQNTQGPSSKTLAVNVNAKRTGQAMDMLKAINAGHSLNEQLGYFIERRMYEVVMLAEFVPKLRATFPLHIEKQEWDDDQQINEAEKITNLALVTDGLAILNKSQSPVTVVWNDALTEIFGTDQNAKAQFATIVNEASEQFDAVSDLVLAETVFQTVKGSPEKAAAALRITGEATDILLPEVAAMPAESRVFTHRTAFVLNTAAEKSWPTVGTTPFSVWSRFAPELNRWLGDQLPSPQKIGAVVKRENGAPLKIALAALGLQAVDFYYLVRKPGNRPEEGLLAWLFAEAARKKAALDTDAFLEVSFVRTANFAATEYSIRELMPLIKSIGSLLEKSRPMRPADWRIASSPLPPDGGDFFDNAPLITAGTAFANNTETGLIPIYLNHISAARTALEQNLPAGFGSPESDTAFFHLYQTIPQAFTFGVWDAAPRCPNECTTINAKILVEQADDIASALQKRLVKANALAEEIAAQPAGLPGEQLFEMAAKLARIFVGEETLVLPRFKVFNTAEIKATLADASLAASIGEFGPEEWLQGLAVVRENMRHYQVIKNLRETFGSIAAVRRFKILQLPTVPGASSAWIGGTFPEGFVPPPNATAMGFEFSANFAPGQTIAGLVIDEWREKIPLPDLTAGASINYNQANSEPPQCLLLVVPPEQKGAWDWETVVNSVLETMTLAKKRAVDNEILQTTWLNQFLPAVVAPLDAKNNTPGLDFRIAGPAIKPIITGPIIGGGVFRG